MASNKCPSGRRMVGVTQVRNMLAAAVLASLLALATSAPTSVTSESDGSQKQSSSLASSPTSSHSSILLPLSSSSSSSLSSPSPSHSLVKRSAPAPYAGHSIMRFGRAAHSIMHFGKRSNEQLEENVANEPIDGAATTGSEASEDFSEAWKQFPLLTDGVNRFVLLPVYGSKSQSKRAKFQDEVPAAVGRDNVFMHFG